MTDIALLIEPFYGGSHKQLVDILNQHLQQSETKPYLVTLKAKKWHWRARTSALYLSQIIPSNSNYKILFCSSVLNLAELIALRKDLAELKKILYFHENQLVYPVRHHKNRDFQYGYNQVLSALVADKVIFNSYYNLNSFLSNIQSYFKIQPDYRPKDLKNLLEPKCSVIYFPIDTKIMNDSLNNCSKPDVLHIIWPHRWEHDKNPDLFFQTLYQLKNEQLSFKVSVLGESFEDSPDIFNEAKSILKDNILTWGRLESKSEYFECLRSGHVAISTAQHEFFGVAMLEATICGCFPIVCNDLVYPEIYPKICLYNTPNQLLKKLKYLCIKPYLADLYLKEANIQVNKFCSEAILPQFYEAFQISLK